MACVGVCGSVNMDVFGYVPRLPSPGETLRGTRLAYAPGGKGANQAVAAARAGAQVRFTSACGRDEFGTDLVAALVNDGIDLTHLRRVDEATGVALILVDDAGENLIVAIPGANDHVDAPAPDSRVDVWLVQAEIPVEAVEGTLAAARATGATALVNPSPAGRVPAALVAGFDVAIVNETELEALGDEHPPRVVLTLGERGVRLLPDGVGLPSVPAQVVDTTGAGDALAGATAAALAEGRPLEDAVRWGIAAASLSVERHGCQPAMPCRTEIEARLRAGQAA
ncbi:MAG TPA: PfkB family carbohydrate kinase [Gaiellales bacterium]|nr:PfkB family carbohydrate kinase [Gaiellales bacterium]